MTPTDRTAWIGFALIVLIALAVAAGRPPEPVEAEVVVPECPIPGGEPEPDYQTCITSQTLMCKQRRAVGG